MNLFLINISYSNKSKLIVKSLFGTLSNKKLAIFGFSFKANTNDTRESPSINISRNLLKEVAKLSFYYPKVNSNQILKDLEKDLNQRNILISETAMEAAEGADAVKVLTEWDEFKKLNWEAIYKVMRTPSWLFNSRICLDKAYLENIGFKVWTLGTP